jgi:hypothetical protein
MSARQATRRGLVLIAFLTTFLMPAASAQALPRVFVDFGVGSSHPVKTTVRPHGDTYNSCPSPLLYLGGSCWKSVPDPFDTDYKIRPTYISQSADGSNELSNIDWLQWGPIGATGSGLQYVRCWPPVSRVSRSPGTGGWPLPPGVPYKDCPGGSGIQDGFEVSVVIHLGNPVLTANGPVFTTLSTSFKHYACCLPPATGC